ncbi:STAS domain-containing protein [Vibrio sp. RE86]|uniref:STAS domain-containing protein n=1 Tax=Vibrio sp. RE86 TaxID=2607605 RepID=UPI0014934F69|nr:STAS domain-containing protein [Vibrio sp. RE86]NOH80484.1 STAS domain-containing protein [Vibrio sp. RE86]
MSDFTYVMPAELTIYEVGETFQELKLSLLEHDCVNMDCGAIEELDTAGFQLLIWFLRYQESAGRAAELLHPSKVVSEQLALFGLTEPSR